MYSVVEQFINWLLALGYTAHTYPPKTGNEFVTVERTGGSVSDLVDHPTVAVQAWAQTEARAEEIAIAIRDELLLSSRPYGVYNVAVNSGPYAFFDDATRLPRYQIVFDVTSQLVD